MSLERHSPQDEAGTSGQIDVSGPVEIADSIFWVGFNDESAGLRCNPYLLVDGDEAVLIDPGSVPHYPLVHSKVVSVISPRRITSIIVHHQDPDLCASIPRFEEIIGGNLQIVTHARAAILIAHYGTRSPFYYVDQNDWKLTLASGRTLRFIFAPYLHFPGAFMTYDEKTGILFSGDIFGALSFDWNLYANEYYIEAMKAFHENYMPSREILASAMKKVKRLDVKMIAPQHGSIIRENIDDHITALETLECGDYLLVE